MMCGKRNFGDDWVGIDSQHYPHVTSGDVYLEVWPDESADLIYCSHGIAYFDRDEIVPLLKAWFRVLKPAGKLQISTPDWDVLRTISTPLIGPIYGKMNKPPIYHKTVYNYHELYSVLRKAGFIDIRRTEVYYNDQCLAEYDGKLISLNIECRKQ